MNINNTICAIATGGNTGALAIIRVSGSKAIDISSHVFVARNGKPLSQSRSFGLVFGNIVDPRDQTVIDEVLVSVFRSPNSYTGEDLVEISCHGSTYIQQKIIELLIVNGATMAQPGDFTLRAFVNGKMDLMQSEAVADLISSSNKLSHDIAIKQLKGNCSDKIKELRTKLLDFSSLIELELDFGEENVEFADRTKLKELIKEIKNEVYFLHSSFILGNAIKNGVPVAIVGKTNVGKSTLLNTILNEDRAIVSNTHGTTRDSIEDTFNIDGMLYRFIDTAGIRQANDDIEKIGIERTYMKINEAMIILYVFDASSSNYEEINADIIELKNKIDIDKKHLIAIGNKIDKRENNNIFNPHKLDCSTILISAKQKQNIEVLFEALSNITKNEFNFGDSFILTNARHYEVFGKLKDCINNIEVAFDNDLFTDLISIDIKQAIYYLGSITGEISTDDILGNIFSKFCIGK